MKRIESRIETRNGKQLYHVKKTWIEAGKVGSKEDYSIRFDGAIYPAWANLTLTEAKEIMGR